MRFFINLLLRQVTMPLLSGSSPPRSCARTTRAASRRDSEAQPRQTNQSSSRTHDSASKETQQAVPLQAPQQAPSADIQHHLVQLHSALLRSSWEPVARPSLTTRLPLSVNSLASFVYFDRITHRSIHIPRPVVAVFKVSEKINTIYFTLPDRLDTHAIPTSHVVYACASHNCTVGLDLLIPAKDSVRPFTKEAYEVFVALAHLNMRVYRQMVRQHLFMHYARIYSEIRHRADALTLGPDATTTIPGIPYFEHYMFNVAKPLAWNCKDITEIFDPPDMKLCFAA
ncbi:hypothetical protein EV121DRAFT_282155 [Schizophyllum commune]